MEDDELQEFLLLIGFEAIKFTFQGTIVRNPLHGLVPCGQQGILFLKLVFCHDNPPFSLWAQC